MSSPVLRRGSTTLRVVKLNELQMNESTERWLSNLTDAVRSVGTTRMRSATLFLPLSLTFGT